MYAIKVENLSKAYQLGQIGTRTLSRDLERWAARWRGKEDSFLKIGETNNRSSKGKSDVVWSLKDVDFEIEQGDTVGIIGKNGAGKSTLLKILSKVTAPTAGKVTGRGRIASLLEVGTGFHPELSGRENIYLNGAILGMRKKEIDRKFNEIVDFAGVERYIDTPVKRYSSGMYVRLAFAVAAHLESEILIVDEVLAVGDAEFQQKCLGKMGEVSKSGGRTVLFVSHNMGAIKSLCNNSILFSNGELKKFDATAATIQAYLHADINNEDQPVIAQLKRADSSYGNEVRFNSCIALTSATRDHFLYGEKMAFRIELLAKHHFAPLNIGLRIEDTMGNALTGPRSMDQNLSFAIDGSLVMDVTFGDFLLVPGNYFVTLTCLYKGSCLDQVEKCLSFTVDQESTSQFKPHSGAWGIVVAQPQWLAQNI